MNIEVVNYITCLICNSDKLSILTNYSNHHLVKCKKCGFVFSNKVPTESELHKVYDNYGRDDYLSPVTIRRYNELLDKLEKYRKTNNILDIGCGIGYFLVEAKKRGWNVYGTEFSDKSVAICKGKGIDTFKGSILKSLYKEEMFDVVTSIEVIEHINNPLEEIQVYKKILRKGGAFYLTTPNFNSIERLLLKEKYNALAYPEHLSYYTPKTIKQLFVNNGFKKIKIVTTGVSISRLKVSKGLSTEKSISATSSDEKLRNSFESSKTMGTLKNIINKILTYFGIGNSLKATFIKL